MVGLASYKLDDRFGCFSRLGLSLRGEDDEYAVDVLVVEASFNGCFVTVSFGVSLNIDWVFLCSRKVAEWC